MNEPPSFCNYVGCPISQVRWEVYFDKVEMGSEMGSLLCQNINNPIKNSQILPDQGKDGIPLVFYDYFFKKNKIKGSISKSYSWERGETIYEISLCYVCFKAFLLREMIYSENEQHVCIV